MTARSLTATLIGVLFAGSALADASTVDGVYQGTLGKQGIVLEIGPIASDTDDTYDGRYFYRRHAIAIPLKIEALADGKLRLLEYHNGTPTGAEWLVAVAGDKASGEFCSCDVRNPAALASSARMAIDLTLVAGTRNQTHEVAYNAQLLDYPLTGGMEIRVAEGIAYAMQADPRFKLSLPRLTKFPDASAMAKVNDALAKALDARRLEVADCLFVGEQADGSYWEEEYRVALLNRDVLSIAGSGSVQCGAAAHPSEIVDSLIYDMRSGEPVDLAKKPQALFKSAEPPWDALRKLYVKYARLSPAIPAECKVGDEAGDVYNQYNQEFDVSAHIYFDAKGLAIDPSDSVAHVVAACFPEVVIPYAKVRTFVRPDSPFYRLMTP